MKVLLINGSPHEKGCTYTALTLIAGELNAAGIETEILNVGTKPVGGCIGCGGCAAGKGCVFGGVVNEAIEKAKTADAFVFGTPGALCFRLRQHDQLHGPSGLRRRQVSGLQARRHLLLGPPRRHHHHPGPAGKVPAVLPYAAGERLLLAMVHGSNPEQVLQDAEGCAVMQELGRNMAWLLHCIEAGKAAGIDHPQNPPAP